MSLPLPLVLALALASPLHDNDRDRDREPRRQRPPGEEIARMIDAYVMSNLQESLGLTDEQFVKVLPLVRKLQIDRRDMYVGRLRAVREINRLLEAGGSEPKVLEHLREVKRLESEGQSKVGKDVEAIDAALTPLQQAKFRVMEMEVERRIREILGKVRREPGGGGRHGSDDGPPLLP
jgi:hypothetical protein